MIIKYQTFSSKNLLVIKYEGNFCIDTYEKQVLDMVNKPEWEFINKVLIDSRFCKVDLKIEELGRLVEIKKNCIKKKHQSVQIVDTPLITALAHLLKNEFNSNKIVNIEYCSTTKTAINLLNLDINENELDIILNNLEHTF